MMASVIWNIVSFIIALGILVAVHEYGHYWVAKKCGVFVERFSIGFGKVFWRKKNSVGTEFALSIIPLGGYVKMLDERVDEVKPEQKHQTFNSKSVYQRIAIIAAGPLANFIFAIFALWLMYLIGVPSVKPVIGEIKDNSIAATASLTAEQQIVAVGGKNVFDWQQVTYELISHIGENQLEITTADLEGRSVSNWLLNIDGWEFDPDSQSPLQSMGIVPFTPNITNTLGFIGKGSAGERAGLMVGDEVVAIDEVELESWQDFVTVIRDNPKNTLKLQINRDAELIRLLVTPDLKSLESGEQIGYLGVSPRSEAWPDDMVFDQQYGLFGSLGKGIERTWRLIELSFDMIVKLVTGDVSVKALSGPISIAQGAGTTASYGVVFFLGFLALISVNLGVINLLPLPVLDGGHLAYYFVEMISGKPVPEHIQEIGFRIGAVLLLALMSIAIFNDIARL